MFVTGDYDLSLSLKYKEPVKAVFKEKIFGHDHTFKTKVYEPHQMCYTQKDTMKDLSWKEFDGAYYSKGGRQGNPAAFGNFTRSSMSVDQKRICSSPKVFNWLQEQQVMFPGFQQRYSNPQIYPTHYLDHIDRGDLNKRHGFFNSLENSITKNHYHHGGVAHHSEEVNLSLSIGRNNMKTTVSTKTFDHIIDLEESDDTTDSNAGLNPPSPMDSTRVPYSGYKCDYQCTHSFTNNTTDNWFDGIGTTGNCFVPNDSTSCFKQNPLAEGVEQCEKPLLSGDISGKGEVLFSDERAFLDLNKSIFDDSFHFDEPSLTCSSSKAFSRESHRPTGETRESTFPTVSNRREQDDDNPNETSDIAPQRILSSVTGYKRTKNVGVEQFLINLNHPLSDSSENPGSLTTDNDDQVSSTRENKSKKAKHDPMSSPDYKTQDFVKVSGTDRSLSSCKSSCFEDISSGIETMQSGTQLKNSNTKKSETLQANISPRQEDVDSSSNSDHQMGETSEVVDGKIIRGAVSLIYLALECSEPTVAINMNKIEDDQNTEQPQCSSDTFEVMVLKQPESSIDDCCVTSNAFEFNATERKDYGITLKRGRRMKDFQRDIMPSLSTLSRHEIYEDIKIMETALRSREYKRHRSKLTDGNKWFNPVRNRRSRLNHVGRKYYS
ncbi:uncharacterized protein LOC107027104 [Solanum pennellii]|uniref:Uncharacterized protein LOC107027104 n=1 Tax=Solanum pennellii TaxID=28526 RepID=A0ABM1HD37_SOLPN|nr:uncharacterized protein LOC107027104 [Solanum pennellii]XP_015083761.1 uncharacterized protein LOC107027104 [Solanum pennellii]XP_015083762.1 uncharacterized protein LOC107027104 [Solanum pennellii]XP_015083763.1 uncharacterized protein LOC107027104 [Solanum pennellii]